MTCILVVEDEHLIREMLVEVLLDAGFEIIEAVNADSAVRLLKLKKPHLIVTDINLPGMLDGIDLACSVRRTDPSMPVVFISGRPGKLVEAQAVGNPAAYLQKPFTFRMFISNVQRLIDAS